MVLRSSVVFTLLILAVSSSLAKTYRFTGEERAQPLLARAPPPASAEVTRSGLTKTESTFAVCGAKAVVKAKQNERAQARKEGRKPTEIDYNAVLAPCVPKDDPTWPKDKTSKEMYEYIGAKAAASEPAI